MPVSLEANCDPFVPTKSVLGHFTLDFLLCLFISGSILSCGLINGSNSHISVFVCLCHLRVFYDHIIQAYTVIQ